ncbi:hypothetical protein [Streptomyces sp. NPDC053431]|uniref:hypothetical protein n=1 Tax=Streptomyces sp. NPDC053431 TaxID=3365703 RepID=UPI0037D702CF
MQIVSNRLITGLSADADGELIATGLLWHWRHESMLASRLRERAVGAGAKHRFVLLIVSE